MCDTLIYSDADSLIRMFHLPVLWSGTDQITGQHIRIELRNGAAHRLFVDGNAFLLSKADSIHFDQVTGMKMTGYFVENELRRLVAEKATPAPCTSLGKHKRTALNGSLV